MTSNREAKVNRGLGFSNRIIKRVAMQYHRRSELDHAVERFAAARGVYYKNLSSLSAINVKKISKLACTPLPHWDLIALLWFV